MPNQRKKPVKKFHRPPPTVDLDAKEAAEFANQDFSHLQLSMRARRDRFIQEYIKDFNGSAAIRRMGYLSKSPGTRAYEWLNEPYTQWKLGQVLAKLDEKAIVTRTEILMGLKREANADDVPFSSNASTRISALRALAKILGMEITKVEGNMTLNGGVMAVPFAGSLDEWEAQSKKSQSKLKTDVRK
jgi:hypothetical protein